MADYWSNFRKRQWSASLLRPRWGDSWEHLHKLYFPKTGIIVLPDAEDRTIVSSFFWTKHWNMTDGQTHGQTDNPWLSKQSTL